MVPLNIVSGQTAYAAGVMKLHVALSLKGGALSQSHSHSAALPYCNAPFLLKRRAGPKEGLERHIEASLWVGCRRCAKCLKFRRLMWRERMENEGRAAARTWFCTFTFSPTQLAEILAKAHVSAKAAGWTPGGRPGFDYYIDRAAYKHFQRYLHRLRKLGARFRYVAVFERGEETGRPHYHALVHEWRVGSVMKRQFADAHWPAIWSAKLVDEGHLKVWRYLSKYLGKSLDVRPRASKHYGSQKR